MQTRRSAAIIVSILAVAGIVIGYVLYNSSLPPESSPEPISESEAVNVSKQSSIVQSFISRYIKAEYRVTKIYVKSNGSLYSVSDDWELNRNLGSTLKPTDDEDHYCWLVHWYNPHGIPAVVDVFVDKDTSEIIFVSQAE